MEKIKSSRKFLPLFLVSVVFAIGLIIGSKISILPLDKSSIDISTKALSSMIPQKDFVFINVHTPYEGEIPNTDLSIPYNEIIANSSLLPENKDQQIILYCKSGNMSKEAVITLSKMGYTNVRHLKGGMNEWQSDGMPLINLSDIDALVLPQEGFEIPVSWSNLGPTLIREGVIDPDKFSQAVKLTPDQEEILLRGSDKKIKIDRESSQFVVDMLWAIGLAQKSNVYTDGPMGQEYKDTVGNFASTGGWTLSRGPATNYLNNLDLISLTEEQKVKVGEIAKNVYRPCCGNSTWFPDCNHGMAALALIELLVANDIPEKDIYEFVLGFNSFWFPQNYLTVATFFARQEIPWDKVDAKLVLGSEYSSGQGSAAVAKKVGPLPGKSTSGGSCGA